MSSAAVATTAAPVPAVIIADPARFAKKKAALIAGGLNKLQVISDFDRTLSVCWITPKASAAAAADGKQPPEKVHGLSSHGVLEQSTLMPAEYRAKSSALHKKYYPLEIDPTLGAADRLKAMEQWWGDAHALLQEYRLQRSFIAHAVRDALSGTRADACIGLRDGTSELFALLRAAHVPLLIFSAGLFDVIEEVLRQCQLVPAADATGAAATATATAESGVCLIANRMMFDDKGLLIGFWSDSSAHNAVAAATAAAAGKKPPAAPAPAATATATASAAGAVSTAVSIGTANSAAFVDAAKIDSKAVAPADGTGTGTGSGTGSGAGASASHDDLAAYRLIHSLNKNYRACVSGTEFERRSGGTAQRPNVLVLGDNREDVHMTDGMQHTGTIVTVGLLNDNISPQRVAEYSATFDVVLTGDAGFQYVLDLLRDIPTGASPATATTTATTTTAAAK